MMNWSQDECRQTKRSTEKLEFHRFPCFHCFTIEPTMSLSLGVAAWCRGNVLFQTGSNWSKYLWINSMVVWLEETGSASREKDFKPFIHHPLSFICFWLCGNVARCVTVFFSVISFQWSASFQNKNKKKTNKTTELWTMDFLLKLAWWSILWLQEKGVSKKFACGCSLLLFPAGLHTVYRFSLTDWGISSHAQIESIHR